jgi:hypothetical protein
LTWRRGRLGGLEWIQAAASRQIPEQAAGGEDRQHLQSHVAKHGFLLCVQNGHHHATMTLKVLLV